MGDVEMRNVSLGAFPNILKGLLNEIYSARLCLRFSSQRQDHTRFTSFKKLFN